MTARPGTVHCVTFIDVLKAFDTVSHKSIVKAAERIGVPPALVSYIKCLYTESITQIRVGNLLGSLIRPLRGVRQGDPLSPLMCRDGVGSFPARSTVGIGVGGRGVRESPGVRGRCGTVVNDP